MSLTDSLIRLRLKLIKKQDKKKILRLFRSRQRGGVIDFKGAQLPVSVLSELSTSTLTDSYLNILGPYSEGLLYDEENIARYYSVKKAEMRSLAYFSEMAPAEVKGAVHHVAHGVPYFYKKCIIREGDVVLDIGAAPGDFSAVALAMGASRAYAFESDTVGLALLEATAALNGGNMTVIRSLVGHRSDKPRMISLDDFVNDHAVPSVGFIKMDIEGAETSAIQGARNLIRAFGPRMSLCTYHGPDEDRALRSLIRDIRSEYQFKNLGSVLYAWVD